jgi:hypothetical protein
VWSASGGKDFVAATEAGLKRVASVDEDLFSASGGEDFGCASVGEDFNVAAVWTAEGIGRGCREPNRGIPGRGRRCPDNASEQPKISLLHIYSCK